MGCSIRELLRRFDSRELAEWEVYYSIEPWGWEQETLYFGTLASLAAPRAADEMAGPRNWFTDELPRIPLDDGEEG